MAYESRSFFLPFLKKEQVAKDTYSFYFDRTVEPSYDFLPGQYNRMFLELTRADERGNSRQFTASSSPLKKEYLTVTTKVIDKPSAFKEKLSQLNPGEMVRFFGPQGKFVLPGTSERPLVFLAGGIGLTPFHSMLLYASEKNLPLPITFFVSFSTVEEAVFYNELKPLEQTNPTIKVIYTITHPEESKTSWEGETGRISGELVKKYVSGVLDPLYFVCGPPKMVEAMVEMVQGMNVPEEQIKKEQFTGY